MKKPNFKKYYDELERQLNLCKERECIAKTRKELVHNTQFENTLIENIGFGGLFYAPSFWIIQALGLTPHWIIPTVILGGSVATGIIIRKIIEAVGKVEEKMRAFSSAKTDKEKYEEEIAYEIELEKVTNRTRAFQSIKSSLETCEKQQENFFARYEVTDKSSDALKKSRGKSAALETAIRKSFEELDILSVKSVLNRRFWHQRSMARTVLDNIIPAVIGGVGIFCFTVVPLQVFGGLTTITLAQAFAVIGAGATNAYMVKRTYERREVFDKFNQSLDKDGFPNYRTDNKEEQSEISKAIERTIQSIMTCSLPLQEELYIQEIIEDSQKWPVAPALEPHLSSSSLKQEKEEDIQPVEEQGKPFTIQKK